MFAALQVGYEEISFAEYNVGPLQFNHLTVDFGAMTLSQKIIWQMNYDRSKCF